MPDRKYDLNPSDEAIKAVQDVLKSEDEQQELLISFTRSEITPEEYHKRATEIREAATARTGDFLREMGWNLDDD